MTDRSEDVRRNRASWDDWSSKFAAPGERNWASAEVTWEIWDVSDAAEAAPRRSRLLPVGGSFVIVCGA
jgi:hypothetical protein